MTNELFCSWGFKTKEVPLNNPFHKAKITTLYSFRIIRAPRGIWLKIEQEKSKESDN